MTSLASLEISIDSRGVSRARDALGRFVKSGKDAERSANVFERSARRLSGTAGVLGKSLGGLSPILLGLGGAAGFRGLVGILREFEDGLVGIRKTTGLAGSGLLAFESDIERLATNSSTAIDGLFGIGEAAGQLGIRGRRGLIDFTDALSKGADAIPSFRGSIEGAALDMGKLLTITGASSSDTFQLVSVIAQLEDSFATLGNQILDTGLEVAKGGVAFGVTADEALGLAAAFGVMGVEAEASRTAVLQTFGAMSKAIATASPNLEVFAALAGQTGVEFAKAFDQSAIGSFTDFAKGLGQFIDQAGVGKATVLLEELGLSGVRLQAALLPLAKNGDVLSGVLKTASEEFATGTKLQDEFAAGSDRLTAALGRMTNTFSTVVDNILDDSTGFAGALRQTVEIGTDVLRVLAGMDEQVRGNVESARLLAGGIIGITGALGAYVAVQALATAGALAFSAVTLATPFGAIALGIGVAAGALFVYKDTLVDLGDDFATVGDLVGESFDAGVKILGISMDIGVRTVALGWDAILDATSAGLDGMLASMTGTVLPFGLKWTDFWGTIVDVVRTSVNLIIGLARGGLLAISDLFNRFSTIADDIKLLTSGEATAFESLAAGGRIAKAFDPADFLNTNSQEFIDLVRTDFISKATTAGVDGAEAFAESFGKSLKTSLKLQGFNLDGALVEIAELFGSVGDKAAAKTRGPFIPTPDPSLFGPPEAPPGGAGRDVLDLSSILNAADIKTQETGISTAIGNIIIRTEDLGFALEHALDLDVDQRKALALRDLGFELEAAGANADEAATFLDGFGLAIDRLDQLERIKNISREFATEMGGAFKDLITGAQSFEDSINNLGRAISDIALDRFVIDPLVDFATGGLAKIGAGLTAKDGEDPTGAGFLGGLLDPTAALGTSLGSATIQVTAFSTALAGATAAATTAAGGGLADSFVGPLEDTATGGLAGAESALDGLQTPTIGASAAMGTVTTAATSLAAALLAAGSAASGSAAADLGSSMAAGASTDSAFGNLFSQGSVHMFGQGGAFAGGRGLRGSIGDMLTNGPVTFPLGVAGEAGPEAILEAMRHNGGFAVKGILGNEQMPLGLTRDSSGSLVVDLGTLKQKPRPFADGAAFNRGFTPPLSSPSSPRPRDGQDGAKRGGDTFQFTYHISTPDPKSFGRSLKQQRSDVARALTNRRPN